MLKYNKKTSYGFVLLTVLWLLAIISIIVSFFAKWTNESIEEAQKARDNTQGLIAMHSTQAIILYTLSTQQVNIAGITTSKNEISPPSFDDMLDIGRFNLNSTGTEIRLDDRTYQGKGNTYFSLQDKSGLYNLNIATIDNSESVRRPLLRILANFNIPAEHRSGLLDKLQDYTDMDDNHRINGAEKYHYRKKSLYPPPNRSLFHPMEIYNVMDWQYYKHLWQNNTWAQLTTTSFAGALNINAAPLFILKSLDEIDAETAEKIITLRQKSPFLSIDNLSTAIGINLSTGGLNDTRFRFYPSEFIRFSLWHKGGNFIRQIHLKITPNADKKQPWYIAYVNDIPMNDKYKKQTINLSQLSYLK